MMNSDARLGAYYFPGWHPDVRTSHWHGSQWTEWELVKNARPRYAGHRQPKVPLLGYGDESDVVEISSQARLAYEYDIDHFIFDWYWYDGKPFLNGAIDAFVQEIQPIDFAIMWANHDWLNIHPASAAHYPVTLERGTVVAKQFDDLVDHIADRYLCQPNYLMVDGGLYFSIYEPQTLVDGLGGLPWATAAFDRMRARLNEKGLPPLHLNLVMSDRSVLPNERQAADFHAIARELRAASTTSYVWIHHIDPSGSGFPRGDYDVAADYVEDLWNRISTHQTLPYYPNVTVGWDSSPRALQTDSFEDRGYPWTGVLEGTPARFGQSLRRALEQAPESGLVSINAWNEWSEGSYLLPDAHSGYLYLEECRAAVGAYRAGIDVTSNMPHREN